MASTSTITKEKRSRKPGRASFSTRAITSLARVLASASSRTLIATQDMGSLHISKMTEGLRYVAFVSSGNTSLDALYMFFVINVFSAAHKFEHMQEMNIRIVDQDNGSNEICRFSKTDMHKGMGGNGFVMGVLRWHSDWKKWVFQVIDDSFDMK